MLFDLGGVLIENRGFERLDALLPRPIGLEALKSRWLEAPAVRAFELGQCDATTFACALIDDWSLGCSVDALLEDFEGWARGFYPGALGLLATLRQTYRVGCLTNSNALHWRKYDGLAGLFDVTLSSHRIGLIKPDAACFAHAIEACGGEAARMLYFDDAKPNVEAANRSGMKAFHAEGFTAVLRSLQAPGLPH